MQLAFVVPVRSSEVLGAAIAKANHAIEHADFIGRIDVRPNESEGDKRHKHPGLCIYVSVPQGVRDPLRHEICTVAQRIVGSVCEAIAA